MTNASGGFAYTSEDLLATAKTLRTGAQRYQTTLRRLQDGLTRISPETVGDDELAQALSAFTDRALRATTGAGNRVEQLAESLTQSAHAMTTRDHDTAHDLARHHSHDQATSHGHHHLGGGHSGEHTSRHTSENHGEWGEDPRRGSDRPRGGVYSGGTYGASDRDDRGERGAGGGFGRVGS